MMFEIRSIPLHSMLIIVLLSSYFWTDILKYIIGIDPESDLSRMSDNVNNFVSDYANLTGADNIFWYDGSKKHHEFIRDLLLERKELFPLNQSTFPNCYLARSNPKDVSRDEKATFITTTNKMDAGPNNNWLSVPDTRDYIKKMFTNSMKGRTLYVVPYCMGPIDSPLSRCGIELTDSPYVVLNMAVLTRTGRDALERIANEYKTKKTQFIKGYHSSGELDPTTKRIIHVPEELSIYSFGSNYGGNALLGKKCHALRIASYQAKTEGWLAEHMLLVCLESPQGKKYYVAAAFPSGCGKTNLAMLIPPNSMPGWKVTTVGDDIAWLHPGADGRLWAINPEYGFFGIVPGTNQNTNGIAHKMIHKNTYYTNVAVTKDNEPWWEGRLSGEPHLDWQARPYDPKNGPAAHPNSRFSVACTENPIFAKETNDPKGVPISAIIFGGRRRDLAPLVVESKSWLHGVFSGASVGSETTTAAVGEVGVLRRDPMAMKPFCGYNFADYWKHWIEDMPKTVTNPPKIFTTNWFRKSGPIGTPQDKFLWPGFGDNLRVLSWITDRCENKVGAVETPIGFLPNPKDINIEGLKDVSIDTVKSLLKYDPKLWLEELKNLKTYFDEYGSRLPKQFNEIVNDIQTKLSKEA